MDQNIPVSNSPTNYKSETPKTPKKAIILVAVLFLLIVTGYFASAYFVKLWPFSINLDPKEAFKNSIFKLASINTATYDLKISAESIDKEEGVTAMTDELFEYGTEQAPLYKRDADRFRDLSTIRSALTSYYKTNKSYPTTLASAEKYGYKAIKKEKVNDDFTFSITFETDDAVSAIKSDDNYYYKSDSIEPTISGKAVTFNKDSIDNYYYFSGIQKLPTFLEELKGANQMAAYIPINFKGSLKASGVTQKQTKGVPDGKFALEGEASIEDFFAKFGFEFLKKSDNFYFRLNQFPGIFGIDAISKIKGKWVKITADDILANSEWEMDDVSKEEQKMKEQVVKQFELFFNLAIEDGVFSGIDNPKSETLNGRDYYNYSLSFDKNKIASFYENFSNKSKEKFGDDAFIKLDEITLKYLKSSAFDKLFNYIEKNIKFNFFVDKKTGYPVKFDYKIAFVADKDSSSRSLFGLGGTTDSNKELSILISLALSDINKGVNIDEPKETINFDDAQQLITGQTKEDVIFRKQVSNIDAVRAALKNYKILSGVYPDSLNDLKKKGDEIEVKKVQSKDAYKDDPYYSTPESLKRSYKGRELLKSVAQDVYTKKDIIYSVEDGGENYKLVYKIELPIYQKGKSPSYSIYDDGYSYNKVTKKATYLYYLQYENGDNTATKDALSQGAEKNSKIDSDKDELSDAFEKYLGTNSQNKDTDGDGVSDGEELRLRFDPLGPGKLEYNYSY